MTEQKARYELRSTRDNVLIDGIIFRRTIAEVVDTLTDAIIYQKVGYGLECDNAQAEAIGWLKENFPDWKDPSAYR